VLRGLLTRHAAIMPAGRFGRGRTALRSRSISAGAPAVLVRHVGRFSLQSHGKSITFRTSHFSRFIALPARRRQADLSRACENRHVVGDVVALCRIRARNEPPRSPPLRRESPLRAGGTSRAADLRFVRGDRVLDHQLLVSGGCERLKSCSDKPPPSNCIQHPRASSRRGES